MLDHLIFNKQKWFNSDSKRVLPRQVRILPGAKVSSDDSFSTSTDDSVIAEITCGVLGMSNRDGDGSDGSGLAYKLGELNADGSIKNYYQFRTEEHPDGFLYEWVEASDKVIPIY